jgi:RHS repeat-associated protein
VTDSRGRTTYEYDARDRLVRQTDPDGSTLAYTYDDAGNRTSLATPAGVTAYTYDALNRLETVTDPQGGVTRYTYDEVGNRSLVSHPNGTSTSYTYDGLNRLTAVVNEGPGGLISSYTYTLAPSGARTRVVEAGPGTQGRTVDYAYDALHRLTSETIDAPGTADDRTLEYTYDAAGNRLTMVITAGNEQATTTYSYDANDRLLTADTTVKIVKAGRPGDGGRWAVVWPVPSSRLPGIAFHGILISALLAFCWLLLLLKKPRQGSATRWQIRRWAHARTVIFLLLPVLLITPANVQALSLSAALEATRASIAQATPSSFTYSYDANGNLLGRTDGLQTDTYLYDGKNRLAAATVEMGDHPGSASFTYDADGIRVSRTVDGTATDYLIDHNQEYPQVILETSPGNVVSYTHGDDLISMARPAAEGGTLVYLYDGQMSTRQLTDSAGAVTDTYTYEAFGNLLSSTGSTINDYLYTGEQYDPNLGFQYLRARYYDPSVGRFTTADPREGEIYDPQSLHKYLYAGSDPVNKWDPTGEFTLVQIAIVSVIIGILAGLATYFFTGDWKKALIVGLVVAVVVAALMFLASYFLGWQFFWAGAPEWHIGIETAAQWNIIHIGRHIQFGWHIAIGAVGPMMADIHIYIQRAFPFFRFWRP